MVNFVHDDLPQLLVILLVVFIIQRIVAFFVKRTRRLADQHIGNSRSEPPNSAPCPTSSRSSQTTPATSPSPPLAPHRRHADPRRVLALLTRINQEVRNERAFTDVALCGPDVPGIDKINGRELFYSINLRVRVNRKDALLLRIIETFKKGGIPLGIDPANTRLKQQKPATPDPISPTRPAHHRGLILSPYRRSCLRRPTIASSL